MENTFKVGDEVVLLSLLKEGDITTIKFIRGKIFEIWIETHIKQNRETTNIKYDVQYWDDGVYANTFALVHDGKYRPIGGYYIFVNMEEAKTAAITIISNSNNI
jgi:hypothetical protein